MKSNVCANVYIPLRMRMLHLIRNCHSNNGNWRIVWLTLKCSCVVRHQRRVLIMRRPTSKMLNEIVKVLFNKSYPIPDITASYHLWIVWAVVELTALPTARSNSLRPVFCDPMLLLQTDFRALLSFHLLATSIRDVYHIPYVAHMYKLHHFK